MTDFPNNPSIEQQWSQLPVLVTQLVQASSRQSQKLEILIDQIGRLTELITVGFHDVDEKFRNLDDRLDRLTTNTEHLLEVATQQTLAIERMNEAQQVTIREQAAIVAAQTENVSRLIQLLDRR
ncbi:hypothetical protein ACKFKG_04135 [Phormidesmis sp. 146-35]